MSESQVRVAAPPLRAFCQTVFERAGVPADSAFLVADALIDADLRGVSTHGLVRFPIYVARVRQRLINPTPEFRVIRQQGATVVLDGDDGFGQVVGAEGMRRAVALARDHGVGLCAMRNSSHLGALAYVAVMAISQRMIGIVMTITNPVIAPWGGVMPKLGNNPLAIAVPAGDREPIILDMACSQVARGNLILADKMGKPIPLTWALDNSGTADRRPRRGPRGLATARGRTQRRGSGPHRRPLGRGVGRGTVRRRLRRYLRHDAAPAVGTSGHGLDVAACCPFPDFVGAVTAMIDECKASPRSEGVEEIFMPGELEARRRAQNLPGRFSGEPRGPRRGKGRRGRVRRGLAVLARSIRRSHAAGMTKSQ